MDFVEIWNYNVHESFFWISKLAASLQSNNNCIFIDTEFPGTLRKTPIFASEEERYRDMKFNIDNTKIIQLGLTIFHGKNMPGNTWQINFKEFNPAVEPHDKSSIQMLCNCGIDFERTRRDGVDTTLMAMKLWRMLMFPYINKIKWVTFHGLYDFGYVIKLLTAQPLPDTSSEFLGLVRRLFGRVYDLKYIAQYYGFNNRIGLVCMAQILNIKPEGQHHQAGHDSRLIGLVFRKLKELRGFNEDAFEGIIFGLEQSCLHRRLHNFLPQYPYYMVQKFVPWHPTSATLPEKDSKKVS